MGFEGYLVPAPLVMPSHSPFPYVPITNKIRKKKKKEERQ